jgi:hypothetical protein
MQDNIPMYFKWRKWEFVDWIRLDRDRGQWWAVVNTVMNMQVLKNSGNCLARLVTINVWRRTLLQGINLFVCYLSIWHTALSVQLEALPDRMLKATDIISLAQCLLTAGIRHLSFSWLLSVLFKVFVHLTCPSSPLFRHKLQTCLGPSPHIISRRSLRHSPMPQATSALVTNKQLLLQHFRSHSR